MQDACLAPPWRFNARPASERRPPCLAVLTRQRSADARPTDAGVVCCRVLYRDCWHPLRRILVALEGLLELYPVDDVADHPHIGPAQYMPGAGKRCVKDMSEVMPECHKHLPLLLTLDRVPPPTPWRACTSRIVQLSVDWYIGPDVYDMGYEKEVLDIVRHICSELQPVRFNSCEGGHRGGVIGTPSLAMGTTRRIYKHNK